MTAPSGAPAPDEPTDPAGSAPTDPSASPTDPSATVATEPPTVAEPVAPGPLSEDAVVALQRALAAEQAAVWAYGLVAAYNRDANGVLDAPMIAEARAGHLLRRDATAARLLAGGAEAAEPAPAYQVSVAVLDVPSARQLAQDIESDAAAAWRGVIGSTDDAELRGFALSGLSDAAVRLAMWKLIAGIMPPTIPFPGQA